MLSPAKVRSGRVSNAKEKRPHGAASSSTSKREKDVLSAEDIKQSKDRINALRNSIPFYGHFQSNPNTFDSLAEDEKVEDTSSKPPPRKQPDEDEEEKEICEGSDSESIQEEEPSTRSIVHRRIASYEPPSKGCSPLLGNAPRTRSAETSNSNAPRVPKGNTACNESYQPTEISKGRFLAMKEKYQRSVTNMNYGKINFRFKDKPFMEDGKEFCDLPEKDNDDCLQKTTNFNDFSKLKMDPASEVVLNSEDKLIYKIKSEIDNLESKGKIESSNVIVGNKDILKLLSNKHLANLNIRVERTPDFRKERLTDNRWRENLGSFRASKFGVKTSFRSSKRRRRHKGRTNAPLPSEEKGASDCTRKENDTESEEELKARLNPSTNIRNDKESLPYSSGEYVKKKFPEYAKVNKRKGGIGGPSVPDIPPRSLSTSPIERAPVVKKICSSGIRLKKDSEPSLMANPVKKADSFRGSRVTRRNSFLYNTRGKSGKEGTDHESFVKTQAVRLRRKTSKNAKKSEYRVSVTIRPSTVANLANKFNTIILQNQTGNNVSENDVPLGNVSLLEPKIPKYYSSPRASFKRKYRHKASRAAKELKDKEKITADPELRAESQVIDNTIYFSENLSLRRSLNNSLSELNMKDLFEDCDYNKTDEEKVCEKLKTALSSGKFKGETDDSEDDLSSKPQTNEDTEVTEQIDNDIVESKGDTPIPPQRDTEEETEKMDEGLKEEENVTSHSSKEYHSKSDSIDSGILTDECKVSKESCHSHSDDTEDVQHILKKDNTEQDLNRQSTSQELKLDIEFGEVESLNVEDVTEAINTTLFVDNLIYAKADTVQLHSEKDSHNVQASNLKEESISSEKCSEPQTQELKIKAGTSVIECKEVQEISKKNQNTDEVQSDSGSLIEDSEVSSVSSELKGKKSKGEMGIYTSLKTAVKNTVKKTKEKDSERKSEERNLSKRSPSRERDKWYKRNKSKERKSEKHGDAQREKKSKEKGKLYEKWSFRRFRDKSEEKNKEKENTKIGKHSSEKKNFRDNGCEERLSVKSDAEKGQSNRSDSEETKDELYGKVKFASRSRSREKRMAKQRGGPLRNVSIPSDIPEKSGILMEEADTGIISDSDDVALISSTVSASSSTAEKPKENTVKEHDQSVYEPHVFTGGKIIPPPPKTPIPSPPKQLTRFLFKHRSKTRKESDQKQSSESGDKNFEAAENIYENIYSPDVETLKKNREKLEEEGIQPISSFLWSESAIMSTKATLSKAKEAVKAPVKETIYGQCSKIKNGELVKIQRDDEQSLRYDKVGLPLGAKISSEDSNSEGHNYTEIQNSSSGDSQTVAYDDIGAPTTVSYDEISPPSCKYDDIRPPSSQGYDPFKTPSEGYDPVNPPKSDSSQYDDCDGGVVMAHLVVVRENQMESLRYVYDDIATYNASQISHSYEPVCPPDTLGSGAASFSSGPLKKGLDTSSSTDGIIFDDEEESREHDFDYGESDESGSGPHEVFSYKLTQIGGVAEQNNPRKSSKMAAADSKNKDISQNTEKGQRKGKKKCSATEDRTKDAWEDITDSEEDLNPIIVMKKLPLCRREPRPKRARVPRYRVIKRSWTQGVREVAAIHNHRIHAHSISSSLAKVNPHAHGRAQITPTKAQSSGHGRYHSDQVISYSWRQKRTDSENDAESPGHYEAIYEVISPTEEEKVKETPVDPDTKAEAREEPREELKDDLKDDYLQCHPDDVDLDDSFDSDDSDEPYSRLRPQIMKNKTRSLSRDIMMGSLHPELSLEKGKRAKYSRSYSHQPHSINRIAEAANLGMKRLRRNWSLTKNELRTGLSRIKKKSTFSMSEIKSTEDILGEVNGTVTDKGKWSLKGHLRGRSASALPSTICTLEEHRNSSTFYLNLTSGSEGLETFEEGAEGGTAVSFRERLAEERRKSITPSVSSVATTTSCETTTSTKARPLSTPVSSLYRKSSSGSNSGTLFRPTNPPPAPPSASTSPSNETYDDSSTEISKDKLASRLNQLLSAGPVAPPGRRVLRTSESCSSADVSSPPLVLPSEDKSTPCKYPLPPLNAATSLRQLFPESSSLNAPQTRSSVASNSSHGSSEIYIRPSDIASSPPPLPARPAASCSSLKRVSTGSLGQGSLPHLSASRSSDGDNRSYLELTCESHRPDEEEPTYVCSHFADEPLYQFYTAKVEQAALYQGESSEDDYEVINDGGLNMSNLSKGPRPTAMELVTPTDGRRTLWCELPEVISSGILGRIGSQERKIQEAMFEVVTSEASYLKSLGVLVSHFMNCPEFFKDEDPIISWRDRNVLFSDILPVKKCSELFLGDLEKRWQESFYISSITDVVLKHATSSFNVYVKYCSNQIYQDRKLRGLKENNLRFVEVLSRLETSPVCQSLSMQSFLMLPMQRVTRLPLLIDAIFNRLEYGSPQWQECKIALASLQKIVAECNEAARKMERMEEMLLISHQLDFREVKAIPLISASRWLVKKGELTRLTWKEGDAKLTLGRKISKHSLYFFLFTDLLVVTKKKSDDQHMVLDYCPRNMVQVLELESADKFPGRILDDHKNLIIMTMLQNHENKTVEMVLSCPQESDLSRWMEAVTPRISENPDERIYEEWDCPQVQAIHLYAAKQPDELSLDVSDVFNVLKKTSDGWYQGERLRDGARGWFPGNHTAEIASAHVRARNLRQRYRLLAISGSIVDELKKEKERFEKEEKKKERRRTITIKEVL